MQFPFVIYLLKIPNYIESDYANNFVRLMKILKFVSGRMQKIKTFMKMKRCTS